MNHSIFSGSSPIRRSPKPEDCRPQLRRTSSTDKVGTKKPAAPAAPKKTDNSKINTWNGRPRSTRPSLTTDTYVSPFQRNTTGRRSVSALGERRISASANSSPTHSRLKQELLNAVKKANDDETIALQVNICSLLFFFEYGVGDENNSKFSA